MSRLKWPSLIAAAAVLVGSGTAVVAATSTGTSTAASVSAQSTAADRPGTDLARQLQAGILAMPDLRHPRHLTRADVTAARPNAAAAGTPATSPPTTAECRKTYQAPCFSGLQLAHAYRADAAHRAGLTGRGVTVVLPTIWGSDRLAEDLALYSRQYHLPAPNIEVHHYGKIPPMPAPDDPMAPARYEYAEETTLDATAIHSIAPDARIVVLATNGQGDETYGPYPAILAAMRSYTQAHPGVIFSHSYGSLETGTPNAVWNTLDRSLAQISRLGATMVVSNGDTGDTDGQSADPVVPWPASSPHVTAVAGTGVHLDDNGNRLSPDTVWSDTHGLGVATGGGLSAIFGRPTYQDQVKGQVGNHRATSDFAMNADVDSRIIVRSTYNVLGGTISNTGGWYRIAGTSEAAPLTAGLLALVRQAAGQPLGNINPALYALAAEPARAKAAGLLDVTSGCNAVAGNPGYCARTGWDIVSGNGTAGDTRRLVPALALASRHRR
ncbi:hypothetical protein GCM10027176_51510 [Actinoallomurus bryophytorum]